MLMIRSYARVFEGLTLLALVALAAGCGDDASSDVDSEEAFLNEVRLNVGLTEEAAADTTPAPQEQRYPKIELETKMFEMGVIKNDRLAHREMKVYNRGTVPLHISRVSTSCGCTVGQMRKPVIPPGGEGILEITVDPARVPGFYTVKTLTLFNDDPTNPYPKVDVATHVEPEVTFEPKEFNIGTLDHGVGAESVIHARQMQDAPMKFSGLQVRGESPYIVAELEEVPQADRQDPDKREYLIKVKVTEDAPPGSYRDVVYINTNLARHKSVPLQLEATVVGIYSLSSDRVALRDATIGEVYKDTLALQSKEALEILELSNANDAITVTHRPGEETNSFVFDVVLGEGAAAARLQRDKWTVKLKTGGEEYTETVDVSIVLRRPS